LTASLLAMLVGLFGVPLALLWMGHRLWRHGPMWRSIFWGGLIGHGVAACATLWASMKPAAEWGSDDTVRGFLVFWALLAGAVLGAVVALIAFRRRDTR
jgi:hypothetical protein